MSKRTPKPWKYDGDNAVVAPAANNAIIAWLPGGVAYDSRGQNRPVYIDVEANAHLIAAAPDLLAACKLALEWLDDVCDPSLEPFGNCTEEGLAAYRQIEAAIAKAEGTDG